MRDFLLVHVKGPDNAVYKSAIDTDFIKAFLEQKEGCFLVLKDSEDPVFVAEDYDSVIKCLIREDEGREQGCCDIGEWIVDGHHIECNRCGAYMCDSDREGDRLPRNFCPNCGARMLTE